MRQSSLLDSFIRKQQQSQKKQPEEASFKSQKKPLVNFLDDYTSQAQQQIERIYLNQPEKKEPQRIIDESHRQNELNYVNRAKRIKMQIDDDYENMQQNVIVKSQKRNSNKKKRNTKQFDDEEEDQEYDVSEAVQQNEEPMDEQFSEEQDQFEEDKANKPKKKFGRKKSFKSQMNKSNQKNQNGESMVQSFEGFTDVTPEWATPQGCRDTRGHKPDHPDYDYTSLYVPPEAYKSFTETMKQYWKIKSQNFDKIILFKLGKFYQLFYEDAAFANKHLELKWMGSKMHVGFPEKTLDRYSYEFMKLGAKVVVVEQLQTAEQMKERIDKDRAIGRKSEKALVRGVTQIITKGTIVTFEDRDQYLPNYLIAISIHGQAIAYSLLEMGTNIIMLGLVDNIDDFKTMLYQTRPVELLYDPDNVPTHILEIMKKNWLQMLFSKLINKESIWHHMNAKSEVQSLIAKGIISNPTFFNQISNLGPDAQKLLYSTLSGMFKYLKNCMKFDYIMSAVKFSFYQRKKAMKNMILDSQALLHLQIFETPLGEKDSLFSKIDRTSTKFGKRMFRRWIMQPLLLQTQINQRLDAIEDLEVISSDRQRVYDIFSKLPDMDKIVNRLYHYSVKTIAEKAIYFEDVSAIRLKQFRQLLEYFNKSWNALELLRKNKSKFTSKRLIKLLTVNSQEDQKLADENDIYDENNDEIEKLGLGLLPFIKQHLQQFQSYIKWDKDTPVPQKGLVASYDHLQDQVAQMKLKLDDFLESLKNQIGVANLKFAHTKERYQIQIPEHLEKKRLEEMIFTSRKAGFSRYVTKKSRKLVTQLEQVENNLKEQMGLFVGFFFEEFRKKRKIWEDYIAVLAELDCLVSLSIFSKEIDGSRPQFVQNGVFKMQNAKHPCLKVIDVIGNDIDLQKKVMLLTGPNMGGKSTILRTTCIMSILAQVGCYVPASRYEAEIVDRIFTRIGASDKLEEGKSTFMIEMEETNTILKYATSKSLVIMDELGRGTSTFDGMAIAYSVLKFLLDNIFCRCIFATHYHTLSEKFKDQTERQQLQMMMMNYIIIEGKVVFLYKLKDGRAGESFGLNVAKMVGLDSWIIKRAAEKASEMEQEIQRKNYIKKFKKTLEFAKGGYQ